MKKAKKWIIKLASNAGALAFAFLLTMIIFNGCSSQSDMHQEPVDEMHTISAYLPITIDDQFRLTVAWRYPYAKTNFTESELLLIYNAIESLYPYGSDPPWGEVAIFGQLPILYSKNESHKTVLHFAAHNQWGTFVQAFVDDLPGQWFSVDAEAFGGIVDLMR